jgi:small subunit ribosomal protein S1
MSNPFLPEGRLLDTPENQRICASLSALQRAVETETILEGRAVLCTPEHDLVVSVGNLTGIIPREEAALGIREGTTREIAILSKVGKPVSFIVTEVDMSERSPMLILSRRRAQERALRSLLYHTPLRSVLPATVTHLENFGAFVDIGCGVVSMIGIENISVSRISHANRRFTLGQHIYVLLTGTDPVKGRVFLSHKELLGTWLENAALFAPGMTVSGYVRGIKDYGAFIELAPNLTGLSDHTEELQEDDRVSVYIKSLIPDRMKIKLLVIHRLEPERAPPRLRYYVTSGIYPSWRYPPRSYCERESSQSHPTLYL